MKASIFKNLPRWVLSLMLMADMGVNIHTAQAIDNNVRFSGALVSEPCNLDPQTSDIVVDFHSQVAKYLYLNVRTKGIPFVVNLTDCDTSLGNKTIFTFKGAESAVLPGKLAVTGTAAGIAIGMETLDGVDLPFNKPTPALSLATGKNSYQFMAYVIGEPVAIQTQSITPGDFSAAATFELTYP